MLAAPWSPYGDRSRKSSKASGSVSAELGHKAVEEKLVAIENDMVAIAPEGEA